MVLILLLFGLTLFCAYFFVSLAKHQSTPKKEPGELIQLSDGWKIISLRDPSWKEVFNGPFFVVRVGIRTKLPGSDPIIFIAKIKRGDETREAWLEIKRAFWMNTSVHLQWVTPGGRAPEATLTKEL